MVYNHRAVLALKLHHMVCLRGRPFAALRAVFAAIVAGSM